MPKSRAKDLTFKECINGVIQVYKYLENKMEHTKLHKKCLGTDVKISYHIKEWKEMSISINF